MSEKRNLNVEWIEDAIKLGLAKLSQSGALVVETGAYTGRAVNDRHVAKDPSIQDHINWGPQNREASPAEVQSVIEAVQASLARAGKIYTYRGFVGPFPVEVQSVSPWHALFASHMFRQTPALKNDLQGSSKQTIRIFHNPNLSPAELGVKGISSKAYIGVDFARTTIGICGTQYAGEIKKSAFASANYLLPPMGHFPMHASANCRSDGTGSSVLFGLSGTGKTTLSAVSDRPLIGDDEIIWTDEGLWNLEGGCYAKLIKLSQESEPEIFSAVNRWGAIQENVVLNESRVPNFDNDTKTENTRGSYPLGYLPNVFDTKRPAGHPTSIIFLTADAFGALPAVAKLNPDQAEYHFISGYTARVAGTELGVKEPSAVFSSCFGAPFMPRSPAVYSALLRDRMLHHKTSVWIVNTGWTNGGYGKGPRFPIAVSRAIVRGIQSGELDAAPTTQHPIFGFAVPKQISGVDAQYLKIPEGPHVNEVAQKFIENAKKLGALIPKHVLEHGGPRV